MRASVPQQSEVSLRFQARGFTLLLWVSLKDDKL